MKKKSKFIKIKCPECKNKQVVFSKAAGKVKCLVCSKPLAESTGGEIKILGEALEVLE